MAFWRPSTEKRACPSAMDGNPPQVSYREDPLKVFYFKKKFQSSSMLSKFSIFLPRFPEGNEDSLKVFYFRKKFQSSSMFCNIFQRLLNFQPCKRKPFSRDLLSPFDSKRRREGERESYENYVPKNNHSFLHPQRKVHAQNSFNEIRVNGKKK